MPMDYEKLEILTLLSQFDKEEIQQIMIIMTYWDEMIKDGIVNNDDINNLSMLSKEKQNKIKEYVSHKINKQIERNNDGKEE